MKNDGNRVRVEQELLGPSVENTTSETGELSRSDGRRGTWSRIPRVASPSRRGETDTETRVKRGRDKVNGEEEVSHADGKRLNLGLEVLDVCSAEVGWNPPRRLP
ncbi:hypothetical protein RND81_07G115000 [Saponaria officinalis]|uniref:Uncharacterized protein n=1 Tax=Saponaria officinalis TaxID=3572 RepID=A0AAW1JMD2_SAPOF